jgi:hypothetical protein
LRQSGPDGETGDEKQRGGKEKAKASFVHEISLGSFREIFLSLRASELIAT